MVATAIAVQLVIAVAVVEDRLASAPDGRPTARPTSSPTPRASRSPQVITPAQAVERRRTAVSTARFTASQVCLDSSSFVYDVVESSSDVIESVIDAHDPTGVSGIFVKVTLLPGAVSYVVLSERGECDA